MLTTSARVVARMPRRLARVAGESIVMQRPDTDRLGDRGAGHYLLADDVLSLSGHIVTNYIRHPLAVCVLCSNFQSSEFIFRSTA